MFPILEIYQGLPASGKSTAAKAAVEADPGNTVRINRDSLRTMLHNDVFIQKLTEPRTVSARNALIRDALKRNLRVICDDTNLDSRVVKDLVKIAEFFGAEVRFTQFDVDINECIRRDKLRADIAGEVSVGEKVIRSMVKNYFIDGKFPEKHADIKAIIFQPVTFTDNAGLAVIFDIDGTVADHQGIRSPYDYTSVIKDRPRMAIIKLARLYSQAGYRIIFCSGREDSCRPDTIKWLDTYLSFIDGAGDIVKVPYVLFMRETGDKRQDRIIKGEIFDNYIRGIWNVELVLDDRDQVVSLWRNELKLDCAQVNYGDF